MINKDEAQTKAVLFHNDIIKSTYESIEKAVWRGEFSITVDNLTLNERYALELYFKDLGFVVGLLNADSICIVWW
jgi:hypothetical protein